MKVKDYIEKNKEAFIENQKVALALIERKSVQDVVAQFIAIANDVNTMPSKDLSESVARLGLALASDHLPTFTIVLISLGIQHMLQVAVQINPELEFPGNATK